MFCRSAGAPATHWQFLPGEPAVNTGNLERFDSRPIKGRFFTFPLNLTTTPQDFYIKASSQYSLTVPIELWLPQAYFESTQDMSMLQALYFGELIALVLYNFLLFLYLRDKSFLYYTLFGVGMGMAMFAGNGYGRMYLWQNMPHWDEVAQCACLSIGSMFGILFTNVFLNTKQNTPKLHKVLGVMAVGYALITVMLPLAHLIGFPANYLFVSFAILAPLITLLLTTAGVLALKAGQREARFFLLAWGLLWTGAFIAAMRAFGVVPSTPLTSYAVQISSAFEMLLLSFALADRIRIERIAREQAQQEKLTAEKALVRTLKDTEQRLETTVAERTAALETSLVNERNLRELYVRFGAFISHEFRNPLNLIQSQIALFRRERQRKIDHGDERLDVISNASNQLAELFDRWLESDRLNYSLTKAELSTLLLNQWLPAFIDSIQGLHTTHTLELTNVRNQVLVADESLFKTALLNLIDNACKYSDAYKPVRIALEEKPGYVGVSVKDEGMGITPENQSKIFEEYFRCNTESKTPGIGLGLAFVRQIMDLHHGMIELKSTPGEGSYFCLWFPTTAAA